MFYLLFFFFSSRRRHTRWPRDWSSDVCSSDLAGLNAGRWDYMFSIIKKFRTRPEFTLPERNKVTMTVPFMRAYTELLVKTCHRREATEEGLRNDVGVALQYLSSWLRGTAAVAIFNLMEDAATAEIARSQVWQWVHNGVKLAEGATVTPELVRRVEDEELDKLRRAVGDEVYAASRAKEARELFERVALGDDFIEFLTVPAYDYLE